MKARRDRPLGIRNRRERGVPIPNPQGPVRTRGNDEGAARAHRAADDGSGVSLQRPMRFAGLDVGDAHGPVDQPGDDEATVRAPAAIQERAAAVVDGRPQLAGREVPDVKTGVVAIARGQERAVGAVGARGDPTTRKRARSGERAKRLPAARIPDLEILEPGDDLRAVRAEGAGRREDLAPVIGVEQRELLADCDDARAIRTERAAPDRAAATVQTRQLIPGLALPQGDARAHAARCEPGAVWAERAAPGLTAALLHGEPCLARLDVPDPDRAILAGRRDRALIWAYVAPEDAASVSSEHPDQRLRLAEGQSASEPRLVTLRLEQFPNPFVAPLQTVVELLPEEVGPL